MRTVLAWAAIIGVPVVILGGLWSARRNPALPNVILPTQMTASPADPAHSLHPALVRVAALPPMEQTLARGQRAFHYAATDADRKRAGRELMNPFRPTSENLAAGKAAYEAACLVCHGTGGNGDGPIIPKFPNPPGFRSKKTMALTDGEMFHTITLGRKKMARHDGLVTWDERWQIILHIRSLQKGKK